MKRSLNADAGAPVADRRGGRPARFIGAPVTLLYKGKMFRGTYTVINQLLVVSCGSVSKNVERALGQPEAQARRVLFDLASTGKLAQFAAAV